MPWNAMVLKRMRAICSGIGIVNVFNNQPLEETRVFISSICHGVNNPTMADFKIPT